MKDPSGQGNGITSIGKNYEDANDYDQLSIDFSNLGKTKI